MPRSRSARQRPWRRHIVLFGEGPIAYRLADNLTHDHGASVSVMMPAEDGRYAALIKDRLPRMKVRVVARPDEWQFEEAGGHRADAFALVSEDDAANVAAWLAVRALWPTKRVVVRIDDQRLRDRLQHFVVDDLGRMYAPTVHVLSPSAVMAPLLVASALGEPRPLNVAGIDLFVGKPLPDEAEPEDHDEFEAVLGLFGRREAAPRSANVRFADLSRTARATARRWTVRLRRRTRATPLDSNVVVLPPSDSPRTRLVLGRYRRPPRLPSAHPRPQQRGLRLLAFAKGLGGGTWLLAAAGLVLVLAAGAAWSLSGGGGLVESVHQAFVKALNGVSPGEVTGGWRPWIDLALALLAATVVPVVAAVVVTSWLFDRARLTNERGPARPMARHVVVVGLGDLGDKVLLELRRQRVRVVGIDIDPNAPGVATAHRLGVPVVIGDARNEQVMSAAYAGRARAVLAFATNDAVNIEAVLATLHLSNEYEAGVKRWLQARLKARWISWVFPGPVERELRVGANVESKVFSERLTDVLTSTSRSQFKELEHVANAHNASDMTYAMFLAAVLGATPLDVVPYGKKVLVVAMVVVEPGSALTGRRVSSVAGRDELRLLGFDVGRPGRFEPYPSTDDVLWPGRRLVVIGTSVAIARLARQATARRKG